MDYTKIAEEYIQTALQVIPADDKIDAALSTLIGEIGAKAVRDFAVFLTEVQ